MSNDEVYVCLIIGVNHNSNDSPFSRIGYCLSSPWLLSENSIRREIDRKFQRQGGKGKITGGVAYATLRRFWSFQHNRWDLQAIAAEGYFWTAAPCL